MNSSILNDVKKMLGLTEDYKHFDQDIIICINAALSTLIQVGLPANKNFNLVDSDQTWGEYINPTNDRVDDSIMRMALRQLSAENVDRNIGMIKSYVYLKTKLVFDPPQNSFTIESINKTINEYESRINIEYDKPL